MANAEFKKKDLRSGYVVECRNGKRCLVARAGMFTQILVFPDGSWWGYLKSGWTDDLTYSTYYNHLSSFKGPHPNDIMKVWGLVDKTESYGDVFTTKTEHRKLLWSREPEAKKLTVDEISKLLGYKVEIVGESK